MGGEVSTVAKDTLAMFVGGNGGEVDTEPTPIGALYFKEIINAHLAIECNAYTLFCKLNRAQGNPGFLMGGAQAGPLQEIFAKALNEFTEKGPDHKLSQHQRGEITADVAVMLHSTTATVQWPFVKKKLWRLSEEHHAYHLRISNLARTAMDSGLGMTNSHRIFLRNLRGAKATQKLLQDEVEIEASTELQALCRNIYVTFDPTYIRNVRERQNRMQKKLSFSR
jgi:hypothetical protein